MNEWMDKNCGCCTTKRSQWKDIPTDRMLGMEKRIYGIITLEL
jgi:hypothetical protein